MLIRLALILILIMSAGIRPSRAEAQSANFRAQARYYTAKAAFEQQRFHDAATALFESRQMLGGKSNERLQYLLVLSLYRASRFVEARTETRRFFDLLEDRELRENFTKDVDRLTPDEVREITIIFDEIEARAAHQDEVAPIAEINSLLKKYSGNRDTHAAYYYEGTPFNCDAALTRCVLTMRHIWLPGQYGTVTSVYRKEFAPSAITHVIVHSRKFGADGVTTTEAWVSVQTSANAIQESQVREDVTTGPRYSTSSAFTLLVALTPAEGERFTQAVNKLRERAGAR